MVNMKGKFPNLNELLISAHAIMNQIHISIKSSYFIFLSSCFAVEKAQIGQDFYFTIFRLVHLPRFYIFFCHHQLY